MAEQLSALDTMFLDLEEGPTTAPRCTSAPSWSSTGRAGSAPASTACAGTWRSASMSCRTIGCSFPAAREPPGRGRLGAPAALRHRRARGPRDAPARAGTSSCTSGSATSCCTNTGGARSGRWRSSTARRRSLGAGHQDTPLPSSSTAWARSTRADPARCGALAAAPGCSSTGTSRRMHPPRHPGAAVPGLPRPGREGRRRRPPAPGATRSRAAPPSGIFSCTRS